MLMFLALSIYVLFISFMQSVNEAEFLIIIYFFSIIEGATFPVSENFIVPLTSIYALLHHINFALTSKF